jgi:cyclic dehypoxanthinyl futalosine synthase
MGISKEQALDCLRSADLIGIGMEADAVRRELHPEGVVTYAVRSPSAGDDAGLYTLTAESFLIGSEPAHIFELHRRAHRAGIRTTAGMVIGAGESLEDRVEHLFAIRTLQEETDGFTAFAPYCLKPAIGDSRESPTAVEYMRTLAVARMVLDNIENVESSCVAQGLKVVQMALRFGANDAGVIPAEGRLSFTEEDLRRVIRDAGFRPVERDPSYGTMFLNS